MSKKKIPLSSAPFSKKATPNQELDKRMDNSNTKPTNEDSKQQPHLSEAQKYNSSLFVQSGFLESADTTKPLDVNQKNPDTNDTEVSHILVSSIKKEFQDEATPEEEIEVSNLLQKDETIPLAFAPAPLKSKKETRPKEEYAPPTPIETEEAYVMPRWAVAELSRLWVNILQEMKKSDSGYNGPIPMAYTGTIHADGSFYLESVELPQNIVVVNMNDPVSEHFHSAHKVSKPEPRSELVDPATKNLRRLRLSADDGTTIVDADE